MSIFSTNPIFDYLLESSHRDDSNKWSKIGFGEEITQIKSIEVVILSNLSGALHLVVQSSLLHQAKGRDWTCL